MRREAARVTQALALLAGASAAHAQIPITIDDAHVVEQSAGPWLNQTIVRLPGPAPATVTVDWSTVPGSATTVGNDFVAAGGTVTFLTGEDQKPVGVTINGDAIDEWSPTLQQDEVFFIQLSNPSANATLGKARATITLLDDDRPTPGVQFLTAASTGDAASGQNTLQWRVPAAPAPPTDVLIRWNTGAGCASPANTTTPLTGAGSGQGFYVANFGYVMGAAGAPQTWPHTLLLPPFVPYCYSLFAYYGATPSAELGIVKATPFDATAGPLKWTYSPGCNPPCAAATVVPPTVGVDAIYTVDNAGVVHAMLRGDSGGPWPGTWNPVALGAPAQTRSPVVPTPQGWRLFVGTDGGGVHALDARDGRIIWSRSAAFSSALPSSGGVQAPPAGLFKYFGGNNDMILVGTNGGMSNAFFALDPQTGTDIASYPTSSSWDVLGMAAVDYAANRVYFATWSGTNTLFALDLGPPGAPDLTLSPLIPNPTSLGFGTPGSLVLRNNRVYVGAGSSIFARDLAGGLYSLLTGDGLVKGFMWPDRRNNNLYFATNLLVQGVEDLGGSFNPLFQVPVSSPSTVLQRPGTDELYVGDGNGRLVRIDVITGSESASVVLEPGAQIGAPSLDYTNNAIIVGSSTGVIYAVSLSVIW
jgi:hypothetical protein